MNLTIENLISNYSDKLALNERYYNKLWNSVVNYQQQNNNNNIKFDKDVKVKYYLTDYDKEKYGLTFRFKFDINESIIEMFDLQIITRIMKYYYFIKLKNNNINPFRDNAFIFIIKDCYNLWILKRYNLFIHKIFNTQHYYGIAGFILDLFEFKHDNIYIKLDYYNKKYIIINNSWIDNISNLSNNCCGIYRNLFCDILIKYINNNLMFDNKLYEFINNINIKCKENIVCFSNIIFRFISIDNNIANIDNILPILDNFTFEKYFYKTAPKITDKYNKHPIEKIFLNDKKLGASKCYYNKLNKFHQVFIIHYYESYFITICDIINFCNMKSSLADVKKFLIKFNTLLDKKIHINNNTLYEIFIITCYYLNNNHINYTDYIDNLITLSAEIFNEFKDFNIIINLNMFIFSTLLILHYYTKDSKYEKLTLNKIFNNYNNQINLLFTKNILNLYNIDINYLKSLITNVIVENNIILFDIIEFIISDFNIAITCKNDFYILYNFNCHFNINSIDIKIFTLKKLLNLIKFIDNKVSILINNCNIIDGDIKSFIKLLKNNPNYNFMIYNVRLLKSQEIIKQVYIQ